MKRRADMTRRRGKAKHQNRRRPTRARRLQEREAARTQAHEAVFRPLIRVPELARRLNLTRRLVYQWVESSTLPRTAVIRSGRSLYLKSAVIENWLAGRADGLANGEPRHDSPV